jgi:geranylgeranyl reductase family protein
MTKELQPVAVIGGGPAGALAAERVARSGQKTVLFDDQQAWEKPCGGGITRKAFVRYPYLAEAQVERNWIDGCELISPAGRRVRLPLGQKLAIYSRTVLNGMLLGRAHQAGAELVADRVVGLEGEPGDWRLKLRGGSERRARYVVIATGARNPFRARFMRAFAPGELLVAVGYYIPGTSNRVKVRFLPGLEGYIWTFPRRDHYSVGIASPADGSFSSADLRRMLEEFLETEGFAWRGAPFYSHILPLPNPATLTDKPFCGEGWAMVGDAAGVVDPITGEGIYYALRSGELAAEAIVAGEPARYQQMLEQEIVPELIAASAYSKRIFCGTLLGQPVLERLVQITGMNTKFSAMVADLFAGAQAYVSLRGRCYQELLPAVWQRLTT